VSPPEPPARLDDAAVAAALARLPGWRRDGSGITKTWKLKDFAAAMRLVEQVAAAAEAAGHHPDIHVEGWNSVRLVLSTHDAGGITKADTDLATTLDALAG
jgi:4a-hydroxytetrahydrobiopterin dehydratase